VNKFLFHTDLKYRLYRHITFFVVIVLVFTLVLFSRSNGRHFGQLLFLTVVNAIFFLGYGYLMIFVVIPLFLPAKKYFLLGILFFGIGILLSVIKLSISDFIFYSSISPEFTGSKGMMNVRSVLVNTKDMSFIVALFVIAKFTKDWLIAESQKKGLERKYAELKLRLLQGNFEPHFLFNTLNNLYSLSLNNPEKTLDFIRKFRRVLQFSITEAQKEKVQVTEEMSMIDDFVMIEQARYGDRLRVESNVSGSCAGSMIAPFILFPLVENCFRHGSSADAGSPWISLLLACNENRICFETKNSVPPKSRLLKRDQENGLSKLRQRLEMLYPKKYLLIQNESSGTFTARLELELN
jgi:sensor histidine kinase YesM